MLSFNLRGLQTIEQITVSRSISSSNTTDDNVIYTQGYNAHSTSQSNMNVLFFLVPAAIFVGLIIFIYKYKKQIQEYCVDPPRGPPPRVPSANYLNGNWTVIRALPKCVSTGVDNKDGTSGDGDDEACSICFNDFFPKAISSDTHDITASSPHDHTSSLTDDYSISIHSLDIDTEHSSPTTTDPTTGMLEKQEQDTVVQLPCQHIFHHSCIATWTEHHNSCPVCRFKPTKNPTEAPEVIIMTEERILTTPPPPPTASAPAPALAETSVPYSCSSSSREYSYDECGSDDRFSVNTCEAPEFTSGDRILHTHTGKNIAYN